MSRNPLFEYWKKRDPIARLEDYLVKKKKWLTTLEKRKLIAGVETPTRGRARNCRELADANPESAAGGLYCENGCHEIKPKYGMPKARAGKGRGLPTGDAPVHLR